MANERPAVPNADNASGADKPTTADNIDNAARADKRSGADNTSTPAGSESVSRTGGLSATNADKAIAADKTGETGEPSGVEHAAAPARAAGKGRGTETAKTVKPENAATDNARAEQADRQAEIPAVRRSRRRSNRAGASRLGDAASAQAETAADSGITGRSAIAARSEKPGRSAAADRSRTTDRSDRSRASGHSGSTGRSEAAGSRSPRPSGVTGRSAAPLRSDRSARNTNPQNALSRWTWRDYALQLSVVIIGIVVTFAGSGVIERWRVAREVRATMQLVHAELETNRADFMQVWDYQQWEMRACKQLTDNRCDLKRIPPDTMASFDPVYGRIHFFHPRRDAFEVLKNSGLMSSMPDKDFLLTVTQGYAALVDLEENISMYYQLKLTAQNDMSKAFSEKQRECFYSGGMYERWECIFSVPCFAEFLLTAPYYFPEGYIEGLLAHVDRAGQAIETKYRSIKKTTDD